MDETPTEKPRQLAARRGFSVFYRGKTLLSTIDPIGQAERLADAAPILDRTLYFCASPLYGYGLERLLGRIREDSAIICVEADEALMALSRENMVDGLSGQERLRLVRTTDAAALCAFVRETWGSRRFRRVTMLRLSGGWQLYPELYDSLAESLRQDIATDWGNAMTLVKLGRRYIRNALRNLPLIPCAQNIADLNFGATPVLVLGAGPSLDTVLDGLAAACGGNPTGPAPTELTDPAKRPFRIICVDTALEALAARNIKPDLAVALESQHWNLRDFVGLGSWDIPVAMDLSALPATALVLGSRPCLFFTPWAPLRIFDRLEAAGLLPEKFPPLGSVGLTVAAIGRRLTTGPVIIAGIDFSFTLDSFHARSTPSHRERLRRHTRLTPLINADIAFRRGTTTARSKSGLPVRTDPALKIYRDLFEREFGGDDRIRDIIGPGLPLGLTTMSPDDAFAVLRGGIAGIGTTNSAADTTHPNSFAGGGGDTIDKGDTSKNSGLAGKNGPDQHARRFAMDAFIRRERASLTELRDILTGAVVPDTARLEALLDECDYLWAHFPECAGSEGRRKRGAELSQGGPGALSFLKRVRTEIDPAIALLELIPQEHREGVTTDLPSPQP
ncbi:hypothetical protein FACS189483_05340 [Spirochaetia bacterium]|nr:hypothetical protein FACS189483_05340 [Spirochaetia bacterium]